VANLTISEAARQAGISRQYLHVKYIKTGAVTVKKDEKDRPFIDSDELLRVFNGRLPGPKVGTAQMTGVNVNDDSATLRNSTPKDDSETKALQAEIAALRQLLQEAKGRESLAAERESKHLAMLDKLTDTVKLLEHRPAQEQPRRGFFARLFGGGA